MWMRTRASSRRSGLRQATRRALGFFLAIASSFRAAWRGRRGQREALPAGCEEALLLFPDRLGKD
jgi:hypothetical protein